MIFTLFFMAFYFVIGEASTPSPKCPPNMTQSNTNPTICYLFVANASSFDNAEKFCNQNNGHLAPVLDAHVNLFIADNAGVAFKNSDSFWLGGKTVNVNGATIWLWNWHNSLIFYSDWDRGQPSKNACISSAIQTALWKSEDCNVAKPFVCQIPAIVDVCDPEWIYFIPPNKDGMCYKYMAQSDITFDQAQSVCQTQNANLVSIHSEEENTFLSNLAKYGSTQITTNEGVFIGLHYSDSKWKWLDGTNVTYHNWGANHPYDETNYIVAGFYPEKLADYSGWEQKWDNYVPKSTLNRFICKKIPGFVFVAQKLL